MKNYVLICHPGLNRVYAGQVSGLCAKELYAAADGGLLPLVSAEGGALSGADCVRFSCSGALSEAQLRAVGRLSAFLALFEQRPDGALLPLEAGGGFEFPDDIVTLLKYVGKTNERFTHLMVHLAECACRSAASGRRCLIDPLCGRGTTLFTALRFGFDALGIEGRASQLREAAAFFAEYLRRGKLRFERAGERRTDGEGRKIADIDSFGFAFDREAFRRGELRRLRFVRADTLLAGALLPKRRFDFLVADLPYGVQHGSRLHDGGDGGDGRAFLSRSALRLADEALAGWLGALKPGASLVLAYNALTTPDEGLRGVLERHGLEVLDGVGYAGYGHRVDRSIQRDLVVARKPL